MMRITTIAALALLTMMTAACRTPAGEVTALNYRPDRAGALTTVRGVLQANPDAGRPGIMMRTHHYTINGHRVFTAGDKLPELDTRTGKYVALTGWMVNMDLEGQSFKEIRPVSVQTLE